MCKAHVTHTTTAAIVLFGAITALPLPAVASNPCKESNTVELALTESDVQVLQTAIGAGSLTLSGSDSAQGSLQVTMCASSPARLNAMQASINKRGNRAILELDNGGDNNIFRMGLFRSANYGYFQVHGNIPASWGLDIVVGSGSATIERAESLRATVGSGDLQAEHINGHVVLTVGSGDAELARIGSLEVTAVGSGDVEAEYINGDATVSSIGSGSVELEHVSGHVTVSSIGSGNLEAHHVGGDVRVGTLGSGRIDARHVSGDFALRVKGSGTVRTRDIAGNEALPTR